VKSLGGFVLKGFVVKGHQPASSQRWGLPNK
jgi:hypothetical protein